MIIMSPFSTTNTVCKSSLSVDSCEHATCLPPLDDTAGKQLLNGKFLIDGKGFQISLNLPLTISRVYKEPVWPVLSQCCSVCSEPAASHSLLCMMLNNRFHWAFGQSLGLATHGLGLETLIEYVWNVRWDHCCHCSTLSPTNYIYSLLINIIDFLKET